MKLFKKAISLLCVAALVLGLAACNNGAINWATGEVIKDGYNPRFLHANHGQVDSDIVGYETAFEFTGLRIGKWTQFK